MSSFSPLQQLSVLVLGCLILASAVWVVWLKDLFRATLSLGVVLLGMAGLFLVLEAEFIALTQLLVYVGAILTLVVFAVMLTANAKGGALSLPSTRRWPAAGVCLALFGILSSVTHAIAAALPGDHAAVSLAEVGQELVTTLVLPFELISLLFVAAVIGAIAVAATKTRDSS